MATMKLPYNGRVQLTSRYGTRFLFGQYEDHPGVDLVGLDDKTLLAPVDGVVARSQIITDPGNRTSEWGNYVRIDTNTGLCVYMCHMSQRLVNAGDRVKVGDPVGIEGSTGKSTDPHVHFEIRINNEDVNPTTYLGISNEAGIYQNKKETIMGALTNIFTSSNKLDGNTPHDWGKEAVEWAIRNEILKGANPSNPDYKLHENVTREEMLVFIYRALKNTNTII